MMVDAARGASAAQITAVMPHFAYARSDKKDKSRISLGGRLVADMLHTAGAHANRVSPAAVLVAVWNEEDRPAANRIANQLRARGIATDVAPTAAKLGKQIKYADKLGIPYVWFPATAAEGAEGAEPAGDEVKNIVTGEQVAADCTSWEPDTVVAQQTVEI